MGESGVLKVGKIYHHKVGESEMPFEYKVMDDIEYSIELFKWSKITKKWEPFIANDIMLEFVMLDPYVRIPLKKESGSNSKFIA